ncbi:MAG TPA: hypothetical protein VHG53_00145 [Candidatus Limnocylindria bacterium]|nr:hypothetical protein [Candidatus Limnocylindria bacterium]
MAAGQALVPTLTAQQRQQVIKTLEDSAKHGQTRLEAIRDRLQNILGSVPTVEFLVHLVRAFYAFDPETYRESEQRYPAILVEYPTWLSLQMQAPKSDDGPVGAELLVEAASLIKEMLDVTNLTFMSAHLAKGRDLPTTEDEIVAISRMHVLSVRNPGFALFGYQLVEALFAPVDADLERLVGFRAKHLTTAWHYLEKESWARFSDALDATTGQVREAVKVAQSGKLDDEFRQFVPQKYRRRISTARLRNTIAAFMRWSLRGEVFARAEELCAMTPRLLSEGTGIPGAVCSRLLSQFALPFGQPSVANNLMSRYEALDRRPLVPLGNDRYLVHLFHLWL